MAPAVVAQTAPEGTTVVAAREAKRATGPRIPFALAAGGTGPVLAGLALGVVAPLLGAVDAPWPVPRRHLADARGLITLSVAPVRPVDGATPGLRARVRNAPGDLPRRQRLLRAKVAGDPTTSAVAAPPVVRRRADPDEVVPVGAGPKVDSGPSRQLPCATPAAEAGLPGVAGRVVRVGPVAPKRVVRPLDAKRPSLVATALSPRRAARRRTCASALALGAVAKVAPAPRAGAALPETGADCRVFDSFRASADYGRPKRNVKNYAYR